MKELGLKKWLGRKDPPKLVEDFRRGIEGFFDEHCGKQWPQRNNACYDQALESFCKHWGARLFPDRFLNAGGPFGTGHTRSHLWDDTDPQGPPRDLYWSRTEDQIRQV